MFKFVKIWQNQANLQRNTIPITENLGKREQSSQLCTKYLDRMKEDTWPGRLGLGLNFSCTYKGWTSPHYVLSGQCKSLYKFTVKFLLIVYYL